MAFDDLMKLHVDPNKVKLISRLASLQGDFESTKTVGGTLAPASNFSIPEVISTGITELDKRVLVIGGIPIGRGVEIAGETHSGKSTLALNICREFINVGKTVVIAENEGTFTHEYAQSIGLDSDAYSVFKGDDISGEAYLDKILLLFETGFDLIVLDSITGILSDKAAEAGVTDYSMNTDMSTPKMLARFFRMLKNGWPAKLPKNKGRIIKAIDSGTTMLVINHLKPILGSQQGFGPPKKESSGSEDIKFYYTLRIWLERLGMSTKDLDDNGNPLFTRVNVTCAKNKLAPSGRKAKLFVNNQTGRFVSDKSVIAKLAVERGLLEKEGSWYTLKSTGERFHGEDRFFAYCSEEKDLMSEILSF